MGTSSSYGGPSDKPGLLPTWALPNDGNAQPPSETPEPAPDEESGGEQPNPLPTPPSSLNVWRNAKTSMTRFTSNRDRKSLSNAANSYVSAKGGARRAAASAISGKSVSSQLGTILSNFAQSGINAGLQSIGLGSMVGESANKILSAISNQLAPSGASLEEEAARMATNDVLAWLYENFIAEDGDISALEQMSAEDIGQAVLQSVGSYIYHRWLQELGKSIEKGAISESTAVRLERDIKEYIFERLKSEMQNREAVNIDWSGQEGTRIINDLYIEAYSILEAGE